MTHQEISFVKSGIRILGYVMLIVNVYYAVALLVVSEVVGVWEEVGTNGD